MTSKYYARVDYSYAGDSKFTIPFSFIKKDHIVVYVNEEQTTNYTYITSSQIEVKDILKAGDQVSIRRKTPINEKIVNFNNLNILNGETQNLAQEQVLNSVQEIYDENVSFQIDLDNQIDELEQNVDIKVAAVSDAVEKLNILDESIKTTVEAAETATEARDQTFDISDQIIEECQQSLADCEQKVQDCETLAAQAKEYVANAYKPQLFQVFPFDHILTYEESRGLALQGTWVYKNAIVGTRYGYPDFYNRCLEEYQNSSNTKQWLKSNVAYVGSIVDTQGVLNEFTASDYIYPNTATSFANAVSTSNSWEEVIKFKLNNLGIRHTITGGSSGTYAHDIYINTNNQFAIALSSNGAGYNIASDIVGTFTLSTNTWYWVKLKFTGTQYILSYSINGIDFIDDIVVDSNINIENTTDINYIGCRGGLGYPIDGSIDLNGTYISINGERWWSGTDNLECKKNLNGHLFYDISQKDIVDEIFTLTGMAWMYGVDEENERIFLPRNNWFEQATGDISEVGKAIEAGLPNIIGDITICSPMYTDETGNNAFSFGSDNATRLSGTQDKNTNNCIFSAHDSNSTYGNSDTVQPNAVKKLLYICVGNTIVEQSKTDVIDVTTTENDTVPLFTGQYFDFTPNNVSWLKHSTTQVSGGIYTSCYNKLVLALNPVDNIWDLKVIDIADMVDGTDYSLYWKVDQKNMTFTTPSAILTKSLDGGVKGNGMTLGLTNGTVNVGLQRVTGSSDTSYMIGPTRLAYDQSVSETVAGWGDISNYVGIYGVTTDPTKSGIIAQESTAQLYFKVANAVENLDLLNAGEAFELLNDLTPIHCVVEVSSINLLPSWYRVWSDGWIEQGGIGSAGAITLLKPFNTTDYTVSVPSTNKTTDSFNLSAAGDWYACGY